MNANKLIFISKVLQNENELRAMWKKLSENMNGRQILIFFVVYFSLISTYFFSTHLFAGYCTPWSWTGFLQTPFLTETLQCRALKWLFTYSHEYIRSLWLIGSTYLVKLTVDFFSALKDPATP